MKRLIKISLLGVFLFSVVHVSLAKDVMPPDYRGLPGSTYQAWEFNIPFPIPTPDIWDNPYGTPEVLIAGGTWGSSPDGGAWYDTPMDFWIPNTDITSPDSWKELRIQVTLVSQDGLPIIGLPFIDMQPPGDLVGEDFILFGPDMVVYIQDWIIKPNPFEEYILIDPMLAGLPGMGISEVVIDTICIPEPATFGLLGLGVLLFRKRKP